MFTSHKYANFIFILFVVLITNYSIIAFNMMYPEQPTIYLANQAIQHFSDLITIYLHPQFLHADIPFFRPSGHFLIYQLLTPILGWHNTKALFVVNFIFLAIAGYFLIKLYEILFTSYRYGGWIAFGIYVMHPALSLSKLTLMHFEFAYVAFTIWSLYLFVTYCHSKKYLYLSLLLYIVAVTFKEPAIMLGPVMISYYLINQKINKPDYKIIGLILITSSLLSLYILSSWPTIQYAGKTINIGRTLGTANAFLTDALGFTHSYITSGFLAYPNLAWRTIVFPDSARYVIWILLITTAFVSYLIFKSNQSKYKQSLLFIYAASLLFLILPLGWGMAAPWHYSLTILMLSLAMGFSIEYLIQQHPKLSLHNRKLCFGSALLLCLLTLHVNHLNIDKYSHVKNGSLALALNRNAIFNPPDLKGKLNNQSIIVVEDSLLQNDYIMGNAAFPFLLFLKEGDYDDVAIRQQAFMMKFDHTFSGTLFRYAYEMPAIKEEVLPFKIENMNDIPNEILYTWLQQGDNIFAVGYDQAGNWHDKTEQFKRMLAFIERERQLTYNQYQHYLEQKIAGKSSYTKTILFPDKQLCSYTCDQDKQCIGFTLTDSVTQYHHTTQCEFYHQGSKIALANAEQSDVYIKEKTSAQRFDNPYIIAPLKQVSRAL